MSNQPHPHHPHHEDVGAQSYDAPESAQTVVAKAVAQLAQREKGRSLMAALARLDQQWQPNGRPHSFLPDQG